MSAALPLVNAGASMIDENDVGDHGDHGDHWRICFVNFRGRSGDNVTGFTV